MLIMLIIAFLLTAACGAVGGVGVGSVNMVAMNAVKMPWVLILTMLLCVPTLYICNALLGARLGLLQTAAIVLCAITMTATLLASPAPIAAFFMFTGGEDYAFIVLMNSAFLGLSGVCGWRFAPRAAGQVYRGQPNAAALLRVCKAWLAVYGLVGM